jgi:hypothetical protein
MPQVNKNRAFTGSFDLGEEVSVLIENSLFFLPHRTITDELLALNEEMNDDYLAREFNELVVKKAGPEKNGNRPGPGPEGHRKKGPTNAKWHKRALEGLAKMLFHNDNEPEISDEEFGEFFQKDVTERIFDHLSLLARPDYNEGDEPYSILDLFTRRLASNLGLKLIWLDETPETFKERAQDVLHRLAWDFQNWLLKIHDGYYPALFGGIYAKPPPLMAEKDGILVLFPDVPAPARPNNLWAEDVLTIEAIGNRYEPRTISFGEIEHDTHMHIGEASREMLIRAARIDFLKAKVNLMMGNAGEESVAPGEGE